MDADTAARIGRAIIDGYDLDFGHAASVVRDRRLLLLLEAPGGSIVPVDMRLTERTTADDIVTAARTALRRFTVAVEFGRRWSAPFARRSHMDTLAFVLMLDSDDDYFMNAATALDVKAIADAASTAGD